MHANTERIWATEPCDERLPRGEFIAQLADAIATLPRRHREVMGLYYHRTETAAAIAKKLDLATAAVRRLHAESIEHLRKILGRAAYLPPLTELTETDVPPILLAADMLERAEVFRAGAPA